ncbi:cytochrome b/b6 domain-containing protein [Agrococcus sp. Marseille-Q4369]|nr:cytochrome b/b6 domain-containing protein [Agrococcus sp. Marseille-Q4369]
MEQAVALRRGLPRVPGGEPWPPASAVAADLPTSATAATPIPADPPPQPRDDAATVVDAMPVEQPVAATPAPAPAAVRPAPAGSIRRGLPRFAGGEPWPPATGAPAVAAAPIEQPAGEPEQLGGTDSSPAAPVERHIGTTPAPETASGGTESSAAAPVERPIGTTHDGGSAVRRGLPRVRGGEPWPPASAAPAAARSSSSAQSARIETESAGLDTPPAAATRPAEVEVPAAAPALAADRAAEAENAASAPAAEPEPAPVVAKADAPVVKPAPAVRPAAAKPAAAAAAAAPSMRPVTARQWLATAVIVTLAIIGLATIVVAIARWFVGLEPVAAFMQQYSGTYDLPEGAPVGLPPWLNWSHFFNSLLIVLIIRSGLQVRYERKPDAYWTPKRGGKKTSLSVWLHTSLDVLWVVNGLVFVVLLLATGQWMRIVPTSFEVFPHAISAGLQYVSLDWPTEHGWVNYNALQQLAYFTTVFVAAPLAIITGIRMSRWWPLGKAGLDRAFPVEWARAVHFPVMLYFVVFIVTHVLLVLTTGALRNLNHMYAAREADDWLGFAFFAGSLLVIAAAWFAARPSLLVPIAQRFGTVSSR